MIGFRRLAYIAGPYSDPNDHVVEENIRRAVQLAQFAIERGYCPIVPHLPGREGIYGHAFEKDDGTSRRVALECGEAMAAAVAVARGEFWCILRDDKTWSKGCEREHTAYLIGARVSGGSALVSLTWAAWTDKIERKTL